MTDSTGRVWWNALHPIWASFALAFCWQTSRGQTFKWNESLSSGGCPYSFNSFFCPCMSVKTFCLHSPPFTPSLNDLTTSKKAYPHTSLALSLSSLRLWVAVESTAPSPFKWSHTMTFWAIIRRFSSTHLSYASEHYSETLPDHESLILSMAPLCTQLATVRMECQGMIRHSCVYAHRKRLMGRTASPPYISFVDWEWLTHLTQGILETLQVKKFL